MCVATSWGVEKFTSISRKSSGKSDIRPSVLVSVGGVGFVQVRERGWKPASVWKFIWKFRCPRCDFSWKCENLYVQSAIRQDTRHFDAFWMMDLEGRGGIHTLRKSTNSGTINNSLWKLQQQQLYHPFKRQASNSPNHWAPYLLKASRLGIDEKSPEIHRHSPELLRLGFLIAEIWKLLFFQSQIHKRQGLFFGVCIHPHHPKYEVMAQNKGGPNRPPHFCSFLVLVDPFLGSHNFWLR